MYFVKTAHFLCMPNNATYFVIWMDLHTLYNDIFKPKMYNYIFNALLISRLFSFIGLVN